MDQSIGRAAQESPAIELTDEEKEILTYLGSSKRIDLRWLSEEQKLEIKTVLDRLHNEKRMSLLRISKEVGRSYTAIWGLCRALEIHTRTVAEADRESAVARSKHKRTPFAGTEDDRCYMLGFKNGDLTAWQVSGTSVMVTSTTTHSAFAKLFRELFQAYGHVYEYPMFEEGNGYKWKVATRLDNSFRFLINTSEASLEIVSKDRSTLLAWLAGIIDSDGHIRVGQNNNQARATLSVYSVNRSFLTSLRQATEKIGYHFDGPYLTARRGDTTPKGITYKQDFWNTALQRTAESQALLQELPLRHSEKLMRRELALSVDSSTRWNDVEPEILKLRGEIHAQVAAFVRRAEVSYLLKHKKKLVD